MVGKILSTKVPSEGCFLPVSLFSISPNYIVGPLKDNTKKTFASHTFPGLSRLQQHLNPTKISSLFYNFLNSWHYCYTKLTSSTFFYIFSCVVFSISLAALPSLNYMERWYKHGRTTEREPIYVAYLQFFYASNLIFIVCPTSFYNINLIGKSKVNMYSSIIHLILYAS